MALMQKDREIGNSGSQAHVTLGTWNTVFLVRKLWSREIYWLKSQNWWTWISEISLSWFKEVADWTIVLEPAVQFGALDLKGTRYFQVSERTQCGSQRKCLEEKGNTSESQGFSMLGWRAGGLPATPPPPGECSVRGLGLQQLIQPLPSYQHVNSSHGSETFILLCNLAVLSNRLSIVYFWNNCTLFAGFWWVQSPSTYISLRGPLILLWRN